MQTKNIPRNEWVSYFEHFCTRHHRWPVSMEIMSEEIGSQVEVSNLPLEAIAADLKNSRSDSISITIGGELDQHITHIIRAPMAVYVETSESGMTAAVEVVSTDGSKTLLRF